MVEWIWGMKKREGPKIEKNNKSADEFGEKKTIEKERHSGQKDTLQMTGREYKIGWQVVDYITGTLGTFEEWQAKELERLAEPWNVYARPRNWMLVCRGSEAIEDLRKAVMGSER